MCITGVNDTGEKLFTGVNDTSEKFISPCHGFSVIAGFVDTGDKFYRWHRWPIIGGDNDTGDKFIAGDKNKDAMEVGSCQG